MSPPREQPDRTILTASLTSGIARVAHGIPESTNLIDAVLVMEHEDWESVLYVGDVEYHQTKTGPFPNHQMIVSARPSTGYAALSYTDNDDPVLTVANSYNPRRPLPAVYLVLNGATGSVFPPAAAIAIADARSAVNEWLRTRKRPTCIEWRPFEPTW